MSCPNCHCYRCVRANPNKSDAYLRQLEREWESTDSPEALIQLYHEARRRGKRLIFNLWYFDDSFRGSHEWEPGQDRLIADVKYWNDVYGTDRHQHYDVAFRTEDMGPVDYLGVNHLRKWKAKYTIRLED
jgi:hypothetical protein